MQALFLNFFKKFLFPFFSAGHINNLSSKKPENTSFFACFCIIRAYRIFSKIKTPLFKICGVSSFHFFIHALQQGILHSPVRTLTLQQAILHSPVRTLSSKIFHTLQKLNLLPVRLILLKGLLSSYKVCLISLHILCVGLQDVWILPIQYSVLSDSIHAFP